MDKDTVREILDGGETEDLRNAGDGPVGTIKDPSVVVQFVFDGDVYDVLYGSFGLAEDELDYGVHQIKGVTLGEKEDYYALNLVEADVYTLGDDGTVSVQRYEATPNGWEETSR